MCREVGKSCELENFRPQCLRTRSKSICIINDNGWTGFLVGYSQRINLRIKLFNQCPATCLLTDCFCNCFDVCSDIFDRLCNRNTQNLISKAPEQQNARTAELACQYQIRFIQNQLFCQSMVDRIRFGSLRHHRHLLIACEVTERNDPLRRCEQQQQLVSTQVCRCNAFRLLISV